MNQSPPRRGELRIGTSAAMREVEQQIDEVSETKQSVLIQGETGTGKEVVAREIHARSRRCGKPWVVVNCASLTPESAESELNGHARGSFTGAVLARDGLVRSAHEGTLFLDEVGELPVSVQAKLLRTLEDGSVRAFGSDKTDVVNVRFIAATSANLKERVAAGRFKADLIARFGTRLVVPPLRTRAEDLAELASELVARIRNDEGMNPAIQRVSLTALGILRGRLWPENVRGLRNAIARALARSRGSQAVELEIAHFDPDEKDGDESGDCVRRAADALREVAHFVVHGLGAGRIRKSKIDSLTRQYPELALSRVIADAFYEIHKTELEAKARELFGYQDLEGVRRLRTPKDDRGSE